jgi:transcriptional regulator with XRE-family HTH domain
MPANLLLRGATLANGHTRNRRRARARRELSSRNRTKARAIRVRVWPRLGVDELLNGGARRPIDICASALRILATAEFLRDPGRILESRPATFASSMRMARPPRRTRKGVRLRRSRFRVNAEARRSEIRMSDSPIASAKLRLKKPRFTQDPHAVREQQENNLEIAIGHEVRAYRKKLGLTIADLAVAADISVGMMSKIETGSISPSLTTLQALSKALGAPLTAFFRRFEEDRAAVFVKAGTGVNIERRGTRAGHQYALLGAIESQSSEVTVEPYLITLTTESDVFPIFQHKGLEFLYMIEGEVVYRHADQLYRMQPGDSLFFDADARHGPEELVRLPARYLSIISYARE